ncbi:MAG TPA: hypothetical protein VGN75_19090, partial [Kaistia sp.]|nr:hypothetical protein [Kaistia sp.]
PKLNVVGSIPIARSIFLAGPGLPALCCKPCYTHKLRHGPKTRIDRGRVATPLREAHSMS